MKDSLTVENHGDWSATSCTHAVKKPRLVGFWYGSSQAFSAVIYTVTMNSKTEENDQDILPDGDVD